MGEVIITVLDNKHCPECGSMGSPKIQDHKNRTWWKCHSSYEKCRVAYFLPGTDEIEIKQTPEEAKAEAERINKEIDEYMIGKEWYEAADGVWMTRKIEPLDKGEN